MLLTVKDSVSLQKQVRTLLKSVSAVALSALPVKPRVSVADRQLLLLR